AGGRRRLCDAISGRGQGEPFPIQCGSDAARPCAASPIHHPTTLPPRKRWLLMLDLIQVSKSYSQPNGERLPILNIPRYHVEAGEQVVLMGRSGSGKTTLLHIIAGISQPD